MKVIVLGGGLVGGPIACDLKDEFEICVADKDKLRLHFLQERYGLKTVLADISDQKNLKHLLNEYDMAISAVPGFMGFQTLKTVIESGKDVVDIAFFPEDATSLNELAIKNGVIAITDMGVAPGMSNLLSGYASTLLQDMDNLEILVGGLPKLREWPWEYKAVFSPSDVIEEYTRPARFVVNHQSVVKPALSEPELVDFPGIGTLEAFNSDGLRSLAHSLKCPNMVEKTLRYPGHIEKIKVLMKSGFFKKENIQFTTKILFDNWKLNDKEADITVMQIKARNQTTLYTWNLLDEFDPETGIHSMARTTGYAASAALRLIASGMYQKPGLTYPEFLGMESNIVDFMLNALAERGINYIESKELI